MFLTPGRHASSSPLPPPSPPLPPLTSFPQARPLLSSRDLEALADPNLDGCFGEREMERLIAVAALCIRQSAVLRPKMSQVRRGGEGGGVRVM